MFFHRKFSSAREDGTDGTFKSCYPPFLEGLKHLIKKEKFMAEDKMTQLKMIKKIAEGTGIAQKYVKEVLESTIALVRAELLAGRQVKVTNLGTFKPATRGARTYSAPLTDKLVKKPATNTVRFKVTADLKRACNE
jgi:DNA-binding protein HU-beta